MTLQKFNRTLLGALVVSGALGVTSHALALDINASTLAADGWVLNTNYWTTNQNSTLTASEVAGLINPLTPPSLGEAYKQDYDFLPPDEGSGAGYYSTSFSGDPNNATISWDTGAMYYIACPSCYLVVKDGNAIPAQYVFNISTWNGQDAINLSNFWVGPQGAISFVGIYNNATLDGGGTIAMVPEADTYAMLLAGLGLVGFAARRKLSKTV